ncbi:uncharacterized protein LOC142098575 [Mixophyes fleayi]|uniref:uncharacterized protein LOC142098575 n=1 Tax=Mixophyes fleayi TaxID=3061075 RepID=UPI003F4D8964
MDINQFKHVINHFSFDKCEFGNQNFTRILIQFFGYMGHGKSSFINTCKYVWEDEGYKNWTNAVGDSGSHTLVRITYPLTENITLVDNRGFSLMGGYETGEIFAQIGNLLPLDEPVHWSEDYGLIDRIQQAKGKVKSSDFIVPVFVYSVRKDIAPEEAGEIKAMLTIARELTGMLPFVVLTHKTSGKLTEREITFRNMGVERIFAIDNYTPTNCVKTRGKHEEVLRFLHEVINDALFHVNQPRNPKREMTRRRKYVIIYVKEREKILVAQKLDRHIYLEHRSLSNDKRN